MTVKWADDGAAKLTPVTRIAQVGEVSHYRHRQTWADTGHGKRHGKPEATQKIESVKIDVRAVVF